MTEQDFADLLQRSESDTLDFKATHYDFSGTGEEKEGKRAKFVKDILCLSNTPRESFAYIVLGVNCHPDGTKDLNGVAEHIDDAVLQDKVSLRIHPHPRFTYEPIQHEGKTYGLISIPVVRDIGPYFYVGEDFGSILLQHRLYFRRGSQNAIALQEEQKAVYAWFSGAGNSEIRISPDSAKSPWDSFLQHVDYFDPRRSFVLALSPVRSDLATADLAALGVVDWFFVADFDPASQTNGALAACRETIESRRSIHVLTKGDIVSFSPRNATYWYMPRGIDGRSDTVAPARWLDWHRAYSQDLGEKIQEIAKKMQRPVTIVAVWYSEELIKHLNSFLERLLPPLGSGVEVVFVSTAGDVFKQMAEEYEAEVVTIPFHHLISGLKQFAVVSQHGSTRACVLPSSSGAPFELDVKMVAWLEEELEIVHANLGLKPPTDASGFNEFLRGKPISWFDLALHVDVERDLQSKISKAVQGFLHKRRCVRVNLYHEPGSGGSTLARRIIWDLRRDYPCVVLQRCDPKQTVERIQKLFSITGTPVLVVAEGNCLSEQQSDELAKLLASRNVPVVLLQVLRRFEKPRKLSENSYHLESILTEGELYRFESTLIRDVPEHAIAIKAAVNSGRDIERTPFYLGLVAFEREFVSLEAHIARHIGQLNETQKKGVAYLSIAHFYGQQALDMQMFASLFGLPPQKPVDMCNVFSDYTLRLFVKTDVTRWRPAHHLIAVELLEQILSLELGDRRLWRTRLSDIALSFIEFCADCDGKTWEAVTELLQRVFIYRDDTEFLGTEKAGSGRFSKIIMDIAVDEGRLRVFQRLTELFPDNHHFWAHLGRFYSNHLKEHTKAIQAIDQALAHCEHDPLVYHMKGMILRNWAYESMRDSATTERILEIAKQASECFQMARNLAPEDDHGFISEVQLITRVLDYVAKVNKTTAVLAASNHKDNWLREGFDMAEDLLEEVRHKRQVDMESEYESRCKADLSVLYGRHNDALETWQNLLDRRSVYAPPIRRQIVRTMLARHNRHWDDMNDREIQRSVELLQQNITEEPNEGRNIRMWLQALRVGRNTVAIEEVVEKVAYWATTTDSLESHYYLYALYTLLAIDGSALAADRAERALEKCRTQAKYRRDRTKSHEWLGVENGLRGLVHQDALGQWDRQTNFWQDVKLLRRVDGIITQIRGQEAGTIEVAGMKAFFVPGVSGHSFGQAENRKVTFFLGFSYDGLRAWSVKDVV